MVALALGPLKVFHYITALQLFFKAQRADFQCLEDVVTTRYQRIGHCQNAVTLHRFWKIEHNEIKHPRLIPCRHRPSIHAKRRLQEQIPSFLISTKWQVFAFSVPLHCSLILHVSFIF